MNAEKQIVWMPISKLHDNKNNKVSVKKTEDLEIAILENGFTEPLLVTNFGMPEGEYTIISGHRRKSAVIKLNNNPDVEFSMEELPCILIEYESFEDSENGRISGNYYRNENSDPLLYVTMYKELENYLKSTGFEGDYIKEIARRMGMSDRQMRRYAAIDGLITPFHELIENGQLALASAGIFSTFGLDDQLNVYNIILEMLETKEEITREQAIQLKRAYKAGCRSLFEITKFYKPLVQSSVGENVSRSMERADVSEKDTIDIGSESDELEGQSTFEVNNVNQEADESPVFDIAVSTDTNTYITDDADYPPIVTFSGKSAAEIAAERKESQKEAEAILGKDVYRELVAQAKAETERQKKEREELKKQLQEEEDALFSGLEKQLSDFLSKCAKDCRDMEDVEEGALLNLKRRLKALYDIVNEAIKKNEEKQQQ